MNFDLAFYLQRFWRRFPWFLIIVTLASAVGLTLAVALPPVYRAEARLLVESPQIPTDLAASTVKTGAPEALEIIRQRLMTRANLLDLAQRLGVYQGGALPSPDDIVEDMRARTTIDLPSSGQAADVVTVSFDAPTAALSATVTNEIVTLVLQENVALRTATAGQTLDFFQNEVDRLGAELGQLGGKIMQYKLEHKDALPDSLEFRRNRQSSQQERLLQLDREIAGLKERRARLIEIFEATGGVDTTQAPRTPEEAQLRTLKDQLTAALAVYAPTHPNVVSLKARIAALETAVQGAAAQTASPGAPSMGSTTFDLQIADIDSQIVFGLDQKRLIEAELKVLQASIDATPGNAIELDELQRDYDNVQTQYNTAVASLGQARTGDRIEALSKGQRITVIEQAIAPDAPERPRRRLIAVGSFIAGTFLGLGLVGLLEQLNRTVKRPADLVHRLGIQTFATVPYIRTRHEALRQRLALGVLLLVTLVGVPAALLAIHQFYLPLDLLVARLIDKI